MSARKQLHAIKSLRLAASAWPELGAWLIVKASQEPKSEMSSIVFSALFRASEEAKVQRDG